MFWDLLALTLGNGGSAKLIIAQLGLRSLVPALGESVSFVLATALDLWLLP